ncbi:galactonate dehydratase [Auraticoccus monumenti]|uniref:Galactonate dehydratase n=1 Tax=Auraticoccus monumenti TaxID=675864 RepID=A0A1G6Y6F5_9ACTN|nr:galactonate dehydratase [Auraticoccus monumenti]SDD85940.1 galactonate dehydratase [Auraticoccus monumenti]
MRITSVEAFRLSARLCLVRIGTDSEHVGWGEATLESRTRSVAAAVEELAELLLGQDPRGIEWHHQRLRKGGFYRGGPVLGSAVAGLDQALWDLKGKTLGAPVHELLGGPARDRVRIYTAAHGHTTESMLTRARELVDAGYTAVKTAPELVLGYLDVPSVLDGLVEHWEALRREVGPDVDIALDLHARFSAPASRRLLARLGGVDPLFVEEPLPPELQRDLAGLCAGTTVPIATGERLYDRWEVSDVIGSGIAVLQPDLSHAHGISEVVRIAALADLHGVRLAPHCATGPLALAACLQVDLAVPNVLIQECPMEVHRPGAHPWSSLLVGNPFVFQDGHLLAPPGPGLGVEVDEDAVRLAARTPVEGNSPVWSLPDGSYAEW